MAEPQNYMQQVNAQQMARRKQRQQRFSSNVVNPVESQGMMDRLQGSDVGSFSGGGDDSGIVPLNMLAGGGTPATTASYGGGTPATEAGFGDGFANVFGGGKSDGNCVGGQCGPRRGNAVAQLPVSTGPFPKYDDTQGRILYGHNMINDGSRSPDPSTQGIKTQRGIYEKDSAWKDYALEQRKLAHETDLAREPETYALQKKNAETAVAAAELERKIKYHATPAGQAEYIQGLDDQVVSGNMPIEDYADEYALNAVKEQPVDNSGLGIGGGVTHATAHGVGRERAVILTTIAFAHGQLHTDKSKMSPEELAKFDAGQKQRLESLAKIPVPKPNTKPLSHADHVIGNVGPKLKEVFRHMQAQGIDPKDTAAIAAAHAIADKDALELRDIMLAYPPQQRTWSEAVQQNLPSWPVIDFRTPSQAPVKKTKKPLAPNSPEIWGG